jgi:S-DNA-T family DNA segregation ATPase FtsK/SpoIIIE
MVEIANSLQARSPSSETTLQERRRRSWWQGPEIFLIVDDYAMAHNAAPSAFAPLAPYWGNAQQLGIHAVVACPMGLANRMLGATHTLPKLNNDSGGATLLMNGIRTDGPVAGIKLEPRVPGRGVLINAGRQEVIQTPVVTDLESRT